MRTRAQDLLLAARGRYALGAFNVANLEQVHGLFRGAIKARAPVIVQFTRAMRDYAHPLMLEHLMRAAEDIFPEVAFAVHHDHGDEASCADAIASGHYSSVMIDASQLPFQENIAVTRRVVVMAHPRGIAVEAELGQLQGVEDDLPAMTKERKGRPRCERASAWLTDPAQAEEFVARSGCDSLAVAIGTSHGAYKFSGHQRLHLDVLAEIQRRLPGVPLVLHGGSAVAQADLERIRKAGGQLDASARGVSETALKQAIVLGIAKVNIATDGRLLWTRVHREFFRDHPDEFDFMHPGRIYMNEFAQFVTKKCELLGATGKASCHRTRVNPSTTKRPSATSAKSSASSALRLTRRGRQGSRKGHRGTFASASR
jgi:fructose-bisphosphate aldolase class II